VVNVQLALKYRMIQKLNHITPFFKCYFYHLLLVFSFITLTNFWNSLNGQIIFSNPSFEGNPGAAISPPSWSICSGTPDVQPSFFGTTQVPSDGNTYLGFHHEESVSANFPNGIGVCTGLQFSIDVSIVPLDVPGNSTWEDNYMGVNPGYICIYGGYSPCDFQQLLWQSDLITNVLDWQTIQVQLTSTENYTYLNFAPCVNPYGSWTYFGIDNIQDVITAPLPVNVSGDQSVCIGESINMNASLEGASSYSWIGPNGFSSNEQNPTILSSSISSAGTYTVTATTDTCQSLPGTIEITVNDCAVNISGVVNQYSPVLGFEQCNNSIVVSNPEYFSVGSRALIVQMKGATIDSSNSPSFGNILDLGNAGNYEFVNINAINGNNIQIENYLLNNYTINGLVQLITVPQYGDLIISDTLTCMPWNGQIGGVLVFESSGTVQLNNVIDLSEKGFRPGSSSINAPYLCSQLDYFYPLGSTYGGNKGEGICQLPNTIINGRGKNVNGGGGGNDTNSGGAGGSNYGSGGRGGNQWTGCPSLPLGGEGGQPLPYNNGLLNRLFLGGGGGGGHQNDGVATPGTRGAGIVIFRANELIGPGQILANSLNALASTGDGSGGSGGGGTVALEVPLISGGITINVSGGNGGSNNSHGPGGGGGGGLIWTVNPIGTGVNLLFSGGQSGFHSQSGTSHGATEGDSGAVFTNLVLNESFIPWSPSDTLLTTLIVSQCENYLWPVNNQLYTASGIYSVNINAQNGCDSTVILDLTIHPTWDTLISGTICQGEQFEFNGSFYSSEGIFPVILSSVNGCDSTVTLNLTVNPTPLSPVLYSSLVNCPGETVTLSADSVYGHSIYWSGPNNFTSESYLNTFFLTNDFVGEYSAILSENNCDSPPSTINTSFIYDKSLDDYSFPNVITPNNDGINDKIEIDLFDQSCEIFELKILNRWGNIVYEGNENSSPFNGFDKQGTKLNDGIYFYRLNYSYGAKEGFIHIIN